MSICHSDVEYTQKLNELVNTYRDRWPLVRARGILTDDWQGHRCYWVMNADWASAATCGLKHIWEDDASMKKTLDSMERALSAPAAAPPESGKGG